MFLENESFRNLLDKLNWVEGEGDITDEEYKTLVGKVADKVDCLKHVITSLESEVDRLDKIEIEFHKAKTITKNRADRLKKYIVNSMLEQGLPQIQGTQFKISISTTKVVELLRTDCTPEEYTRLENAAPGCAKRKFEYSKSKIGEYLKEHDSFFEDVLTGVAKLSDNKHIRWGVVK
jgi:hypothetical protein